MYKLVNKLVPNSICSIITTPTSDGRTYTTRQQPDLLHFRARTELFDKSFFPSTVRLWNQLPVDTRNSPSIQIFKSRITKQIIRSTKFPELFNIGDRFLAVQHTCLCLNASPLNSHLFKIGVKDSPECSCGSPYEDTWHFFFSCSKYTALRSHLHSKIVCLAPFTLQTLLYGSPDSSLRENTEIFLAVHDYISKTGRFKPVGIG